MADGNFRSDTLHWPGAFIQLIPEVVLFTTNIVMFQYNPEAVSRGITPWNPFESAISDAAAAPDVAPGPPEETISFDLYLDAMDPAQGNNPINAATGVAGRVAALKKLVKPTAGLLDDLLQSAAALAGSDAETARRPSIPITFLIFGPGLMLPVRVTSLGFEQTLFNKVLYPTQVKASVEMQVLNPTMFRCKEDLLSDIAIAMWNFNEMQEDLLAAANLANTGFEVAGLVSG